MTVHRINFRVYYEDTDAGGIVYYANYLKFAERARTEWLREPGYLGPTFARDLGLAFVVRRVEADYRKPARLDSLLQVASSLETLQRTSLILEQNMLDAEAPSTLFCRLKVQLVCIAVNNLKPTAIPASIAAKLADFQRAHGK